MKGNKFMNAVGLFLAAFSVTVFAQDATFEFRLHPAPTSRITQRSNWLQTKRTCW